MIRSLLACLLVLSGLAAAADSASLLARYDNGPAFIAADEVLNRCRLATVDPERAQARVTALEEVIANHADYPDLAMAHYFLGLNLQVVERYGEAVSAFSVALDRRPELAEMSAITSYIAANRRKYWADMGPKACGGAAAVLVLVGLVLALGAPRGAVPWPRLALAGGLGLAAWVALVVLLPLVMGPPAESALEGFADPVLVQLRVGHIGHQPLLVLAAYGAGAILAALVVAGGCARLGRSALPVGVVAAFLVAAMVVGAGYFRHFHGRYSFRDGRLVFLAREIAWKKDVPEAMYPLYHEDFRHRIIAAKKEAAAKAE